MRWVIQRSVWGWSLYYDNVLVGSSDNPFELMFYPAYLRGAVPTHN